MTVPASAFDAGLLQRLRPRRVALFRASRIGDFVCATPAFRAFRAALPDARITLVALPLVAELAARCPSIDRFEPFPGLPGIAEQFFDSRRALEFFARMQDEAFDLVVQMHGSGVYANPIALMFGGRATAGFTRAGDPPGRLDAALPMPIDLPEVSRLLALAAFLGAPPCGEQTEVTLWEQDRQVAASALRDVPGPLIGVHAGARDATKRWAPERFAAAAERLVHRGRRGTVLLLGGPGEVERTRAVAAALHVPRVDLSGRIGLPALAAILERLGVLITNDSGPAHLAYALGTPTVTVFGGTDPGRWRPLVPGPFRLVAHPVSCRPCDYASCPLERSCLDEVAVEEVVWAADELMSRRNAARTSARSR